MGDEEQIVARHLRTAARELNSYAEALETGKGWFPRDPNGKVYGSFEAVVFMSGTVMNHHCGNSATGIGLNVDFKKTALEWAGLLG